MSDPVDHARRVTLDALVECFARDQMRAEEFDRRAAAARAASSIAELRSLLADLPGRSADEPLV